MRKLNLTDYTVKTKLPDKANPAEEMEVEIPYHFKTSILNLLFIPELRLGGAELVRQNMLAVKIESCKDREILLEEEEYLRVKRAVDAYKGFGRQDVELVSRVLEAPES